MTEVAEFILSCYKNILEENVSYFNTQNGQIKLPFFTEEILKKLIENTIENLQTKESIIFFEGPCFIIGDLHGNIFDLLRIIHYTGGIKRSKIVFLGDYVDRGNFSIEVITLLFSLFCLSPNDIVLLRGNHEFESVNSQYGFKNDILNEYHSEELYQLFNNAFSWLPLSCIIDNKLFCVHGGLAPDLLSITQLINLKRPIIDFSNPLVHGMVWADPTFIVSDFI